MNHPGVLFLAPVLAAALLLLLPRRIAGYAWPSVLVALVSLFEIRWLLGAPPGTAWSLWGLELRVVAFNRWALALIYVVLGLALVIHGRLHSGRGLFLVGLTVQSSISLALLSSDLLVQASLIVASAIAIAFGVSGRGRPAGHSALGYLAFMMVGGGSLSLAFPLIQTYALAPDNVSLVRVIVVLVALALAIATAAVPLHFWLDWIGAYGHRLGVTIATVVVPASTLVLFIALTRGQSWLWGNNELVTVLVYLGLLAIAGGALAVALADRPGRLAANLLVLQGGYILLAMSTFSESGLALALWQTMVRSLGALLMFGCLAAAEVGQGGRKAEKRTWLVSGASVAAVGFGLGGLMALGAPLTAGFVAPWLVRQGFTAMVPWFDGLALLASGLAYLGLAKGFYFTFWLPLKAGQAITLPVDVQVLLTAMAAAAVVLGLFPRSLLEPLYRLSVAFLAAK
ncbi:MAG: hypothetical protein HY871_07460 [Chloroflexi bacterium]|nr:hypothetical protein [Chloroflexota bacterium]